MRRVPTMVAPLWDANGKLDPTRTRSGAAA